MRILVVYYSLYGHVLKLAEAAAQGAREVQGAEVVMRRVEEFPDVEKEMGSHPHAKEAFERQKSIPLCTLDDLRHADGVIFGTPTRFGNMAAQMKRLFDSMAPLWMEGAMEGKPAGVFTSTATTHGGQETTLLTMVIPLLHLGMLVVGVPYSTEGMLHTESRGGTPYGASTIAGSRNELDPKKEDLAIARALGKRVAQVAGRLRD